MLTCIKERTELSYALAVMFYNIMGVTLLAKILYSLRSKANLSIILGYGFNNGLLGLQLFFYTYVLGVVLFEQIEYD